MTPKEWADKTIKDIERKRELKKQGERQAQAYSIDNMHKVQRRIRKYE
jgi:hypothetical protein